jgi:hypothetical protein
LVATELEAAGYGIRRTEQHFELASVSWEMVEKFSRRRRRIEQLALDKYKVLESQARALLKSANMAFDHAFAHVLQKSVVIGTNGNQHWDLKTARWKTLGNS